jgi:predicted RNA-binding Zn-ribbon protein involved in translation (DUF1610 family)
MAGPMRSRVVQCDGKRPYASKAEAKTAARRLEHLLGRMVSYRCPHCGRFHIGHRPRRLYC